jgi:hypothetical protein
MTKCTFLTYTIHSGRMPELVDAIDEGFVSLMDMPPTSTYGLQISEGDTEVKWILEQDRLREMDAAELVDYALRSFATRYSHLSDINVKIVIKNDIARQMQQMQSRPPFINQYRRYVLITGESESNFSEPQKWVRRLCQLMILCSPAHSMRRQRLQPSKDVMKHGRKYESYILGTM